MDPDLKDLNLENICGQIIAQCGSMGVNVQTDREMPPLIVPKLKLWILFYGI